MNPANGPALRAGLLPRFQLRMLDALGLAPNFEACVRCGASLDGHGAWLDLESGGLSGLECLSNWMHVLELNADEVLNFRRVAAPRSDGAALHALPATAQAVETLVTYHLGRRPRTVLAQ